MVSLKILTYLRCICQKLSLNTRFISCKYNMRLGSVKDNMGMLQNTVFS